MSKFGYQDLLADPIVADGAQVLNTTTETIMVPDISIPAGYMYQGRTLKYTLMGDISTAAADTTRTIIMRLRWGGAAGVVLATSGSYIPDPTAAGTTVSFWVEYLLTCRSIGTSGTIYCMGRMVLGDYDDASATALIGNLNMSIIPPTAPAVSAAVDTTVAKALSPTVTFSVASATTQLTTHLSTLEALN